MIEPQHIKLSNSALTAFHEKNVEMDRGLRNFDQRVDAILSLPNLSRSSADFLTKIWYEPTGREPLSYAQRPVREAITKAFMLELLRRCETFGQASTGPSRLRMLTVCPNIGYCDYAAGKLRANDVRDQVERGMRKRRLQGFGLIDVALVAASLVGEPTDIGLHYHVACEPEPGETLPAPDAKAKLKSKRQNRFGLAVTQQDIFASPLTTTDVAGLGYYITKISLGLKEDYDHITIGSQLHWSHEHALRSLEALSHVTLADAIVCSGASGLALKEACLRTASRFIGRDLDTSEELDHGALRHGWRELHRDLGWHSKLNPLRFSKRTVPASSL
jgi:hypothetical protein